MRQTFQGWDNQQLPLKPQAVCYWGYTPDGRPVNIYLYGTKKYNGDRYVVVGVNNEKPVKRKIFTGEKGFGNYFKLNNQTVDLVAFQRMN